MRAMILERPREPLRLTDVEVPLASSTQLRIRVEACGLCRTDLHVVDGELTEPKLPLILGHQIVGVVDQVGKNTEGFALGDRIGVPWLGSTCGVCRYCAEDQENLCDAARYTGYKLDGGFAEYAVAEARYCFQLPKTVPPETIAPLLCAGLIGYRAYRMIGQAQNVGFYGFGAAAHLITQVACQQQRNVYAFTRTHDEAAQDLARRLGAVWVGASESPPPQLLDAAVIFAPVGALVPIALRAVRKGGTVVCAGIHMSDIPSFPYAALWGERVLRSVANLTRRDGREFFELLRTIPIRSEVTTYPLECVNEALGDLRRGALQGAAVICVDAGVIP